MSAKSKIAPFSKSHQGGFVPSGHNVVTVPNLPLCQRNFYLDLSPHILRAIFSASSQNQLNRHFTHIKHLVVFYANQINANKRNQLFGYLRFIAKLGGQP